jgi:hypothetical protein
MNAVYIEENGAYQFDFSQALWATDELHRAFHSTHVDLSDVDFVAETETELILLEYKNATITGAVKPEAFRPSDDNKIKKIAWKYYDSWIYLMALKKEKPCTYVYILEYPRADSVTRKAIRNKIMNKLPFDLQKLPQIKRQLIKELQVLSIDEWNNHETYKRFPITPVTNHS